MSENAPQYAAVSIHAPALPAAYIITPKQRLDYAFQIAAASIAHLGEEWSIDNAFNVVDDMCKEAGFTIEEPAPVKTPKRLITDLEGEECIHCKTQSDFGAIIRLANAQGLCGTVSASDWDISKTQTIVFPTSEELDFTGNAGENDWTVYPASDFL